MPGVGEHAVRATLSRASYSPEKAKIAEDWLAEIEDERSIRLNSASLRLAESAKSEAQTANKLAMVAIIIAATSAIIAVLAWLFPHH